MQRLDLTNQKIRHFKLYFNQLSINSWNEGVSLIEETLDQSTKDFFIFASCVKSEVTLSIGQWDKIESMPSAFNVSSVPSSFSIVFFNSISPDRVGVFRITSNHDFETMVHFFWRVWKSMKSQILIQTSIGKKGSSTGIEGSGDELAIFYAKFSLQNRLE